jgi:hypothetical protein
MVAADLWSCVCDCAVYRFLLWVPLAPQCALANMRMCHLLVLSAIISFLLYYSTCAPWAVELLGDCVWLVDSEPTLLCRFCTAAALELSFAELTGRLCSSTGVTDAAGTFLQ